MCKGHRSEKRGLGICEGLSLLGGMLGRGHPCMSGGGLCIK